MPIAQREAVSPTVRLSFVQRAYMEQIRGNLYAPQTLMSFRWRVSKPSNRNMTELTSAFQGLKSFHGFDNYSVQPGNTCGQAVIASMLHYSGKVPVDITADSPTYEKDLTRFVFEKHGPHWPLRNLVSNRTVILRALRDLGIQFQEHITPLFGKREQRKELMIDAVAGREHPVIVLLDIHHLRLGPRFNLHWAVVYAVSKSHVRLSSWGRTYDIPWQEFLEAWNIWFVTWPYHYYMIEVLSRQLP